MGLHEACPSGHTACGQDSPEPWWPHDDKATKQTVLQGRATPKDRGAEPRGCNNSHIHTQLIHTCRVAWPRPLLISLYQYKKMLPLARGRERESGFSLSLTQHSLHLYDYQAGETASTNQNREKSSTTSNLTEMRESLIRHVTHLLWRLEVQTDNI